MNAIENALDLCKLFQVSRHQDQDTETYAKHDISILEEEAIMVPYVWKVWPLGQWRARVL